MTSNGPDGIYINALGNDEGNGPGGIFVLDPETLEIKGRWKKDRRPQQLAYDFWWHLGADTMITSHAQHGGDWRQPGAAQGEGRRALSHCQLGESACGKGS